MKITATIRYVAAILLFLLAWNRLRLWYEIEHPVAYVQFAACFLLGLALAVSREIRAIVAGVSPHRRLVAAFLLFLALPWSEWFRLALPTARADWSNQLFHQTLLFCGIVLLLRRFKLVRIGLKDASLQVLERRSSKTAALVLFPILFFCFTTWITLAVFDRTPLIQDAAAHLFQAKVFREGRLYAPAPRVPEAFSYEGDMVVLRDGKWFGMYLPGFSLMLAAAMLIHCEWVLGPALGAATIAIWAAYALRWHDRKTAAILACLGLFSPMLFLMSASVMIHIAEVFLASCVIYLARKESEQPSAGSLALLGSSLFLGLITRGYSFLPFVAPALLYALWKRRENNAIRFAAVAFAALVGGLLVIFWYQWRTTGSPTQSGYNLEYSQPQYYGFRGEIAGQHHSPLRGLENTSNSLLAMNTWLAGWPAGTLFFLILLVLRSRKFTSWEIVLFLSCLSIAMFYFFWVFQDLVIGPRYWFIMIPVLLLFLARSVFSDDLQLRPYTVSLAVLSLAVYLAAYFPGYITLYDPIRTQGGQLHAEMQKAPPGRTLVLLDRHVAQHFVNWNDPFLRGDFLICRDMAGKNPELLKAYPGYRPVYFRVYEKVQKAVIGGGYRFAGSPDLHPAGFISFFNFAVLMYASNQSLRDDVFDLSYSGLLQGDSARAQLAFVAQAQGAPSTEPEVRRKLRTGLIHTLRLILLPKLALEEKDKNWPSAIDFNQFRSDYNAAMQAFVGAGDTGDALVQQMTRVGRRIDQDDDGQFSDEEIVRYLQLKLRMIELTGS